MDDGEVERSDRVILRNSDVSSNIHGSNSIDSFIDDLLKNTRTCTHTHTCNPPGPDSAAHTHTCFHTHTQVIASEEDDLPNNEGNSSKKARRPLGNREAVRKYRAKKKAHTAYLEGEVEKLRILNQQLVRKLQGRAILEAEVLRLRSLLLDIRGRIDNELGIFPFQKQCNSVTGSEEDGCGGIGGLHCETAVPCLHQLGGFSQASVVGSGKVVDSSIGNCQPAVINCQAVSLDADKMSTEKFTEHTE